MRRWLAALLLGLAGPGAIHAQSEELLEPEKAFALTASVSGPEELAFSWDIADGYYMYRDKFRVQIKSGNATLTELVMPPGKMKADEFFGDQEIYTGTKVIHALVDRHADSGPIDLVVDVTGQGCNEPIGVCYPPLKQSIPLQLAALDQTAITPSAIEQALSPNQGSGVNSSGVYSSGVNSSGVDSLQSLRDLLGAAQTEQTFLDPEEAFRFDLFASDPANLAVRFEIAEGYYLYRDKIGISSRTDGLTLADYRLPPGVDKEDEYFGQTSVYYGGFDASSATRGA